MFQIGGHSTTLLSLNTLLLVHKNYNKEYKQNNNYNTELKKLVQTTGF